MLKQISNHQRTFAACLIILIVWLALVNPQTASPILLLVPFVLIFVLIFQFARWLLKIVYGGSQGATARDRAITWLISLLLEVVLLLSSLGQFGFKDALALVAILIIGLIYIVKTVPVKK